MRGSAFAPQTIAHSDDRPGSPVNLAGIVTVQDGELLHGGSSFTSFTPRAPIMANSGHFDVEIDKKALARDIGIGAARDRRRRGQAQSRAQGDQAWEDDRRARGMREEMDERDLVTDVICA